MSDSLSRILAYAALSVLVLAFRGSLGAAPNRVSVGAELERLAQAHGFVLAGLEQTEDAFGRSGGDTLYLRLRRLLENFDHVIVQNPEGGVERVIVLGEKVPFEPTAPVSAPPPSGDAVDAGEAEGDSEGEIVLETFRRGTQHSVQASIEGKGGRRVTRRLMVDTGADYVVLPSSLVWRLALNPKDLTNREMQTANGKLTARVGPIAALWLGENRIEDVDAAFIDDRKLGGDGLLGMSVLGRYKVTIDDEGNRLILGNKQGTAPAQDSQAGSGRPSEKNP